MNLNFVQAHVSPCTIREHQLLAGGVMGSLGMGFIYLVYSAPLWNRGGRVLVKGSCVSHPLLIVQPAARPITLALHTLVSYIICFFTPHGPASLVFVAALDIVGIVRMKWLTGTTWRDMLRVYGRTRTVALVKKD